MSLSYPNSSSSPVPSDDRVTSASYCAEVGRKEQETRGDRVITTKKSVLERSAELCVSINTS